MIPRIDRPEPKRAKLRKDNEEPTLANCKTEMVDPMRAKLLKDKEEPK